jgi:hypothetical protein
MPNNTIDNIFKKIADNHEENYSPQSWNEMQTLLQQNGLQNTSFSFHKLFQTLSKTLWVTIIFVWIPASEHIFSGKDSIGKYNISKNNIFNTNPTATTHKRSAKDFSPKNTLTHQDVTLFPPNKTIAKFQKTPARLLNTKAKVTTKQSNKQAETSPKIVVQLIPHQEAILNNYQVDMPYKKVGVLSKTINDEKKQASHITLSNPEKTNLKETEKTRIHHKLNKITRENNALTHKIDSLLKDSVVYDVPQAYLNEELLRIDSTKNKVANLEPKQMYKTMEVWGGETMYSNVSIKLGTTSLYNILSVGTRYTPKSFYWGLGYGLGKQINISPKTALNVEEHLYHISQKGEFFKGLNLSTQSRFYLAHKITQNSSIFAGPTFNIMFSSLENGGGINPVRLLHHKISPKGIHTQMWTGFNMGIRLMIR